jgi:hypothetical protein
MMAAATPKTAPAGRCEQLEAAIASRQSRIEADVLAELSHDWRPLTEVRPAVRARGKGGYGYGQAGIEDAIGRLMAAGRVEKAGPGGRPSTTQSGYRTIRLAVADLVPSRDWRPRPTASSPAGERPDRLALIRRACVAVLNDGAAHDFKALSDASPPTASFEQVRAVLGELVRSGQVGIRSVGLERRYQRRPEIACVT